MEINLKVDFQRRERSVITNEPFERLSHMNTCVVFLSRKPDVSLSVRCNNRSSIHVASFSAIGDDLTVIHLALKLNVQRRFSGRFSECGSPNSLVKTDLITLPSLLASDWSSKARVATCELLGIFPYQMKSSRSTVR